MMAEIGQCISENGEINIRRLGDQPLLQSVYAEVLRMRSSIFVSRTVEYQQITFDGYTLQRGEYIIMPTEALHTNHDSWTQAGREPIIPLEHFDPERFIVNSKFDLDRLAGLWIPFGGGDRMCPGRHIAKLEIILSFAYLFSNFDIEMKTEDPNTVQCDLRYAALGTMPPNKAVLFAMRRKQCHRKGIPTDHR
jgi:cytochrome P450